VPRRRYRYDGWPPYVPVAERRWGAAATAARMKREGRSLAPVEVRGRRIATTFWGDAWCRNLEAYSDFANRLPRGRTYVRTGSVIDLQIERGRVRALVSGTSLYEVAIGMQPLPRARWTRIKTQCAGQIASLVELLRGSLSDSVMEIVTRKGEGLFPSPREISLSCSCPDWATMCKHVAATLYGVGARLDRAPELLFTLRCVDPVEMVDVVVDRPRAASRPRRSGVLASADLSAIFGVDIDVGEGRQGRPRPPAKRRRHRPASGARPAGAGARTPPLSSRKARRPAVAGKRAVRKK
jgi:uncharacterized Zn finger protein